MNQNSLTDFATHAKTLKSNKHDQLLEAKQKAMVLSICYSISEFLRSVYFDFATHM
jgi:hypothetical protein